jgi:hypothetical protein
VLDDVPEPQRRVISELFPLDKTLPTFFDLIQNMSQFTRKIFAESDLYKELREMIYTGINNGKMTLDQELNFNEALKDTIIGKSYIDFLKDNIHTRDNGEVPYYDLYLMAYNMLDVFGIKKDKVNAKNSLVNLHNDAMHSYFAQYCDYFVTEDVVTTIKCKSLYKLFGIQTEVVTADEFKAIIVELLGDFDEDLDFFIGKLFFDLKNAQYVELKKIGDKTIYKMQQHCRYLDFFDGVVRVDNPSHTEIVVFKGYGHHLSQPNYSEQAQLILKALFIFGPDMDNKQRFEYASHDRKRSKELASRKWQIGELTFELRHHELIDNNYSLVITFPLKEQNKPEQNV